MGHVARLFRALIMGAPGSGKGTVARRIASGYGLQHISSGDLLRDEVARDTELGRQARRCMKAGELVTDSLMLRLIVGRLETGDSGRSGGGVSRGGCSGWLLDGFPRTLAQAEALQQRHPLDTVICLDVPFPVIVERLKERWVHAASGRVYHTVFNPPRRPFHDDVTGDPLVQRQDDTPQAIERRLEVYRGSVQPLLDFYRSAGVLQRFSGSETNVIWPHIDKYLGSRLTRLDCNAASS